MPISFPASEQVMLFTRPVNGMGVASGFGFVDGALSGALPCGGTVLVDPPGLVLGLVRMAMTFSCNNMTACVVCLSISEYQTDATCQC